MPVAFFILTFAGTWTAWGVASRIGNANLQTALIYAGTFMPAFVAISLTARTGGVRALLEPLLQWRVRTRWYVFALGFILAVKLSVAVIHRLALGAWPRFGSQPLLLMLAGTVFSVLIGGQTGEEIGWRGYALPRLARRLGLAPASVLLGVIWATWHLPLFFLFPDADTHGQSFPLYLLQVTALSVAIAWLWWRAKGSLLLTMLLHSAINNTKDIVPSAQPGAVDAFALSTSPVAWMTLALLWGCAALFLAQMSKAAMR
jgi:membrane protease YdiL (CAAX protease family)